MTANGGFGSCATWTSGPGAALRSTHDGIEEIDALGKRRAVYTADAGTARARTGRHIETHEGVNARLAEFLTTRS